MANQHVNVKHIVEALGSNQREERTLHRKVHRPWGGYDSVDEGQRFKVKRIQVKSKASLGLRKYHRRVERLVVVEGPAEINCGEQVLTLTETSPPTFPWVRCIAWPTRARLRWKSSRFSPAVTWGRRHLAV